MAKKYYAQAMVEGLVLQSQKERAKAAGFTLAANGQLSGGLFTQGLDGVEFLTKTHKGTIYGGKKVIVDFLKR